MWGCEELGLPLRTFLKLQLYIWLPWSTSHKLIDFLVPRVQMLKKKMDSKSHLVLEYCQVFTWVWVQSPAAEILAERKKQVIEGMVEMGL